MNNYFDMPFILIIGIFDQVDLNIELHIWGDFVFIFFWNPMMDLRVRFVISEN